MNHSEQQITHTHAQLTSLYLLDTYKFQKLHVGCGQETRLATTAVNYFSM